MSAQNGVKTKGAFAALLLVVIAVVLLLTQVNGGQSSSKSGAVTYRGDTSSEGKAREASTLATHSAKSRKYAEETSSKLEKQVRDRAEKQKQRLASPKARQERTESRTKYAKLPAAKALAAAVSKQPSIAVEPAWTPPPVQKGERIVDYPSETVAAVATPDNGKRNAPKGMMVASTSGPIAVQTTPGEFDPMDLSLVRNSTTDTWAPARANVQSTIPADLTDPIKIGDATKGGVLSVSPAQSKSEGVVTSDSKIFYANTSTDTDTIVEALPTGAEFSWILRSPNAPSEQKLGLGLPKDAELKLGTGGEAQISRDGKSIGSISAPVATDAQGQPVASKFVQTPAGLTVQVEHVGKDLAYPIAVDPAATMDGVAVIQAIDGGSTVHPDWLDDGDFWGYGEPVNPARYTPSITRTTGGSNRFSIDTVGSSNGGYAYWIYDPIRSSSVARVRWEYVRKPYAGVGLSIGMINPSGWVGGQWGGYFDSNNPTVLVGSAGGPFGNASPYTLPGPADVLSCMSGPYGCTNTGVDNSAAYFEMPSGSSSAAGLHTEFLGAQVYLSDNDAPYLTLESVAPNGNWQASANLPTVTAHDGGLGLGNVSKGHFGSAIEANLDNNGYLKNFGPICDGGPQSNDGSQGYCPTEFALPAQPIQGIHTIKYRASDVIGHRSGELSYALRYDAEAPKISITGRLRGLVEPDPAAGSHGRIARTITRTTPFNIHVTDGSSASNDSSRSGVRNASWTLTKAKSVTDQTNDNGPGRPIFAGGSVPQKPCDGSASQSNCDADVPGSINPLALDPGIYYLNATATDGVGTPASVSYKFAIGVGDITSVSEGTGSARYVPLQVELNRANLNPTPSNVRLQWRKSDGAWTDLLPSQMTIESTGAVVPANPVPLSTADCAVAASISCTQRIIVDTNLLKRQGTGVPNGAVERLRDGRVVFRGIFSHDAGSTDEERASEDVLINLDRGGRDTNDENEPLGTGNVDLQTGNFSLDDTDFSQDAYLSPLTVSRGYDSRYATTRDDSGIAREISPLGAGWDLNLSGQEDQYRSLTDWSDASRDPDDQAAYVAVVAGDGSGVSFELGQNPDGSEKYSPEAGFERLQLVRQLSDPANPASATAAFKLTNLDTNVVTTFGKRDTTANDGTFQASTVDNPGSTKSVTLSYTEIAPNAVDPDNTQLWPSRVVAPQPTTDGQPAADNTRCSAANMGATPGTGPVDSAQGCQALDFEYNDVPIEPLNTPDGQQWGSPDWKAVSGDWNGDGQDSYAGFSNNNGTWALTDTPANPNATLRYTPQWGVSGDIPVAGDWDGDGKDSIGVFRPSNATWYLSNSNTSPSGSIVVAYGSTGDKPIVGDWDGDGKDSIGVFRPSNITWYLSNNSVTPTSDAGVVVWGGWGLSPVAGDWNNDGKDDIGKYEGNMQRFYLARSKTDPGGSEFATPVFGNGSMQPVVGDWNNDGVSTVGMFEPSAAKWYLSNSNKSPSTSALLTQKRLTAVYLKTWDPAANSGNGGMVSKQVSRYTYDNFGRLKTQYDPRQTANPLTSSFDYDANNLLTKITPPGGEAPVNLSYGNSSFDLTAGRVQSVGVLDPANGLATTTLKYGVPLTTGAGGPYDLSKTAVSAWAQAVPPLLATAVFPPDRQPSGSPISNWGDASISYLDPLGRSVNDATPGGRISTTEFTRTGKVSRTLSAANRIKALQQPTSVVGATDSVGASKRLDTRSTYEYVPGDGSERLTESVGPQHAAKLSDPGSTGPTGPTAIRAHSTTTYDEGAPEVTGPTATPYSLPTTTKVSAQLLNGADKDTKVTQKEYRWSLRTPTATIEDAGPGGTRIRHQSILNDIGQEIERRQPLAPGDANPGSADVATTTIYRYYSAGSTSGDADCNNNLEWNGLLCKVGPPPGVAASSKLVTKWVQKYDLNRKPLQTCELSGVSTIAYKDTPSGRDLCPGSTTVPARVSKVTYDSLGRPLTQSMTAGVDSPSIGRATPTVRHNYSTDTGRELSTDAMTGSTVDTTVTREFDTLGRQTSYTDANGNKSTTEYDLLSRPKKQFDGKSTVTRSFDNVTGELTGLSDLQVGSSTPTVTSATYDAGGRLATETLPGGLVKTFTNDETDGVTGVSYFKSTGCSSSCTWYSNQVTRTAADQIVDDTDTFAQKQYSYDAIGRLTRVKDTRNSKCTTRSYTYDADSNRLSQTNAPSSNSTCDLTGGTPRNRTYDPAFKDRLADGGYSYDAFGRATSVPSADAGGTSLTATYYSSDLASSITQDGTTQTFDLDPGLRTFKKTKTTPGLTTIEKYAYDADSDSPSWVQSSGGATSITSPVANADVSANATQIAAGTSHVCALISGGVKCWGDNSQGQLGNGTTTESNTPVAVIGLTSGVAEIAVSGAHSCARTTAGAVKCWGSNSNGQLGDGTTTRALSPVAATGLASGVTAISTGGNETCVVVSGAAKCFGQNTVGQLGNGTTTQSTTAVSVTGLTSGASKISVGTNTVCAVTTGGAAKCWGAGTNGQLGNGATSNSSTPVSVTNGGSGVAQISVGGTHACARITAGAAYCWGANSSGQLGNSSTTSSSIPYQVTGLTTGVTDVSAGANHTCAVVSGAAKCWGSGASGQLGNGATTNAQVPTAVSSLSSGVTQVSSGAAFSIAITSGGAVRGWGDNASGQIAPKGSWTRYIGAIDGDMAATLSSDGTYKYAISNVRGDVVAYAGAGGITQAIPFDEFGNPATNMPSDQRYGFMGNKQREALTGSGVVAMGMRLYVPGTGRFLQVDQVLGGTANAYEYPSDPINSRDLTGTKKRKKKCWDAIGEYGPAVSKIAIDATWCGSMNGKRIVGTPRLTAVGKLGTRGAAWKVISTKRLSGPEQRWGKKEGREYSRFRIEVKSSDKAGLSHQTTVFTFKFYADGGFTIHAKISGANDWDSDLLYGAPH